MDSAIFTPFDVTGVYSITYLPQKNLFALLVHAEKLIVGLIAGSISVSSDSSTTAQGGVKTRRGATNKKTTRNASTPSRRTNKKCSRTRDHRH